jgi:very-short-patch-repair endonuclease
MREDERRSRPMARKLRNRMTKAETVLWTGLKDRLRGGWKFRRQHPVGPYVADFACVEAKLIVEVDGATHSEDREISRDRRRTNYLQAQGFEVLRVTNIGIYEDLDGVVRTIDAALAPLGPSGHSPRERGETSRQRLTISSPACGGGASEADGGGMKQAPNPREETL